MLLMILMVLLLMMTLRSIPALAQMRWQAKSGPKGQNMAMERKT
jgi:hypothetical protein